MKVSVIIPLYNGAKFIWGTLDTVLAQTYRNYEIILVNDGSPDNVEELVKEYMRIHSEINIIYIKQKNKGLGGARNTAIRHSTGEIIAILDQDDIWYPDKLIKTVKVYDENPDIMIVSHNVYIRKNGKISGIFRNGPYEAEMHRALLFFGNRLSTPAVTFRKTVINDVGCFSEDINRFYLLEDYDLWLRIAFSGYKFYFLPNILGEYVVHAENFSKSKFRRMNESELNVIIKHYNLIKDRRPFDWYRFQKRKANMYFRMALSLGFAHSFGESLVFLGKTMGCDPFYFFTILGKMLKKLFKLIKFKREQ